MALQKRRLGPARIRQRRSAWMRRSGANAPLVQNCPECGNPRIPHRVCMSCGTYAREKIIEVASAEADE